MPFGQPGANLLFPYAIWSADFPKRGSTFSMVVSLVQFPVYGLILGAVYRSARFSHVAVALTVVHFVAAGVLPIISR
jgi:hypothetical protein